MRVNKGFTLVEIMVALAVLGIALPALFYVLNSQARQVTYLQQRMLAQWVAANELEKLRLYERAGYSSPETNTGLIRMGHQEWRWVMEQDPVVDNAMHRFVITVSNDSGESVANLSLLLEP